MRRGPVLLLTLAMVVSGCAVNPATGERQLSFVSESQEIQMGREADASIVAQMGLHPDSSLQRYVREIGLELAAASERPDLPWTFRVLDDPTVNAFALPGGFIYVTRGIMSHLNSEAQLAGILGHEIGHVTARHSVNRMSRAQLAQLGLGVGMIFSEELRQFGGVVQQGLGLLFLSFGRDDELESDALGLRYMTRLDYDPDELAEVMEMLDRNSELASGGSGRIPEWLSTHPNPENRVERIQERIAAEPSYQSADVVERQAYLTRLDGMTYGQDPREGFVRDGVFHHPELAFRLAVPAGWSVMNGKQAVQMAPEDGGAILELRLADEDPAAAAAAFAAQEGVEAGRREDRTVNGLPAVTLPFRATTQDGELAGEMTWVRHDGQTYALMALSTSQGWSGYASTLRSSVNSFREETDPEILTVEPMRMAIVRLPEALTWGAFVREYPSTIGEQELSVINQVPVGGVVTPGMAKRVVR